jgi:hypothetical protein
MWTTEIKSKEITDGLLKVTVGFTDGKQTFTDRYETRSTQDANWLNDNIARRISDLEGVVAFADTIPVGIFTTIKAPVEVVVDETKLTPREKYAKKLEKFEKLTNTIKKGIINDTDVDFIATKKWLSDNWNINYFDLF